MPDAIGSVGGTPRRLLRLEGLALLVVALLAYAHFGQSWWWFLAVLAPDISLFAYASGPRVGALVYNASHTLTSPAILAAFGLMAHRDLALSLAAIWVIHIGADRALGYGLKYGTAFADTHLGRIGRAAVRS